MAMRKHPARFRAIRPAAEDLERRQLLSGTVSGINTEGDAWTLTLTGPGSIMVTKQPDANGNPTGLNDPSEINTITIFGTDPLTSRLVGTVVPSGKGSGEVFFQNLTEEPNDSEHPGNTDGPLSIDMPDFYLGLTSATAPNATNGETEPSITIPDGVSTLDFGGVDTTAFFGTNGADSLNGNGENNQFTVALGIPQYAGTRIVVNKIITNSVPPSGSSTTAFQNGVSFIATGRIGLFQANEIDGSTTNQPSGFTLAGGVIVESLPETAAAVNAEIGDVRVGGNATNLSVYSGDKINTFFVGGETNNISILAVGGSRNLYFGKGMDDVDVLTNSIQKLFANRGAVNSSVSSARQIGNIQFGGDVVGTNIGSGYTISSIAPEQTYNPPPAPEPGLGALFNVLSGGLTPTILGTHAQAGGQMRVNIAGNVTNSTFTSSVSPGTYGLGSADDLRLQPGTINARIQGTIDNSTATPESPNSAFYAAAVKLAKGPVVPPTIPEAPYAGPLTPKSLPGVPNPYAYAFNPRTLAVKIAAARAAREAGTTS